MTALRAGAGTQKRSLEELGVAAPNARSHPARPPPSPTTERRVAATPRRVRSSPTPLLELIIRRRVAGGAARIEEGTRGVRTGPSSAPPGAGRARRPVDFDALSAAVPDDDPAAEIVPRLWMSEPERADGEATDDLLMEVESCLRTLRLMNVDRRIKELAAEIAGAGRSGDDARLNQLLMEDVELKRRKQQLSELRG